MAQPQDSCADPDCEVGVLGTPLKMLPEDMRPQRRWWYTDRYRTPREESRRSK